jgi:hypothetical protein
VAPSEDLFPRRSWFSQLLLDRLSDNGRKAAVVLLALLALAQIAFGGRMAPGRISGLTPFNEHTAWRSVSCGDRRYR